MVTEFCECVAIMALPRKCVRKLTFPYEAQLNTCLKFVRLLLFPNWDSCWLFNIQYFNACLKKYKYGTTRLHRIPREE